MTQNPCYYVSQQTGSNKNNGSKEAPFKNLQKALNVAEPCSSIYVAEGNYYGLFNCGNIIITKPVAIIGGYKSDFSERNIFQYKTMIQPDGESNKTSKGGGTVQIRSVNSPDGYVILDGLIMDRGNSISYNNNHQGQPDGVESPMMNPIGVGGIGGPNLTDSVLTQETRIVYLDADHGVANHTNIVIRNCSFINAPNAAIVGLLKGSLTVENCIFVNIRMAVMDVRGADAKEVTPIVFRNNTVMFVWSRLKDLADMGYGFRMIPGTACTIDHNIFGCCTFSALDRTHVDSNRDREAKRIDSSEYNVFFLNREADLTIPGGGMFLRLRERDFDDVEQLSKTSGNITIDDPATFNGKINTAYLGGFLTMQAKDKTSPEFINAANKFSAAFGIPLTKYPSSMYANRYPWQEALNFFGAMNGYGAQYPQ